MQNNIYTSVMDENTDNHKHFSKSTVLFTNLYGNSWILLKVWIYSCDHNSLCFTAQVLEAQKKGVTRFQVLSIPVSVQPNRYELFHFPISNSNDA